MSGGNLQGGNMKDFKNYTIGFLTSTCMFLFMGFEIPDDYDREESMIGKYQAFSNGEDGRFNNMFIISLLGLNDLCLACKFELSINTICSGLSLLLIFSFTFSRKVIISLLKS